MAPEPVYDESLGEKKQKMGKHMIHCRGYEPIHTEVKFLDLNFLNIFCLPVDAPTIWIESPVGRHRQGG